MVEYLEKQKLKPEELKKLKNVKKLKLWLLAIKLNLERAERLGFWNAINPFQGYINTDKSIVENIMKKYKHNF